MFDFLRNLTKSDEDKRQEAAAAFLDDALTPQQTARFEELLKEDSELTKELERQRWVKEQLQTLPAVRAPRNFTLDPAKFGKPARQLSYQIYPALRTATVLAAVLFVFLIGLDFAADMDDEGTMASEAPTEELLSVDAAGDELPAPRMVITESEAEVIAEAPVEEEQVSGAEQFFAEQPAPAEPETAIEIEEEAEMEQPAVEEESAPEAGAPDPGRAEADVVDEAQAEDADLPGRMPSEVSEGTTADEIVGESKASEDAYVAPLPPSEPVTELAFATPPPARTRVPTKTLAARVMTPEQDAAIPPAVVEEAALAGVETVVVVATSAADTEPSPAEQVLADDSAAAPDGEVDMARSEERAQPQEDGFLEDIPVITFIEIVLGIGLLTLIAATILVRRRARQP